MTSASKLPRAVYKSGACGFTSLILVQVSSLVSHLFLHAFFRDVGFLYLLSGVNGSRHAFITLPRALSTPWALIESPL